MNNSFRTALLYLILTVIFAVSPSILTAHDDVVTLTLDESIAMALEDSFGIKTYRNNLESADSQYNSVLSGYKAKISMFLMTPAYSESVSDIFLDDGTQIFARNTSTTYQSKISGDLSLPGNGTALLEWTVLDRAQDGWTDQFTNSLRLTLKQPLFTFNNRKYDLKSAKINKEASKLNYDRNVSNLVYSVTTKFYGLLKASRKVDIVREKLKQSEQSYERAKLKYEAGLIPEVEALELEVNLKQDKAGLSSAIATFEKNEEELKQLLGLDLNVQVLLSYDVNWRELNIDLPKTIDYALTNMDSLRMKKLSLSEAEIALKRAKSTSDFRVDITSYIEYFGNGTDWNSANDNFIDSRNRGVTLTVSVPLFDSGREKYRVISALMALRNSELEIEEEKINVERKIRDNVRNINEAADRVSILMESSKIAEKSYEITRHRFESGAITSQRLLDSQLALTNAKTTYLNALIDYELAVANLKRNLQVDNLNMFLK